MRTRSLLLLTFFFLGATAASAQKLSDQPGYLPLQELGLFPRDKLSVEINLEGFLLRLVARATRGEDPAFADLVGGLKAIRVQVFPLAGVDEASVKTKIGRTVRWLEDKGWMSTVRVREGDDETYIYLKEADGQIVGLTVLSLSAGDEAAMINIVGRIDPDRLGQLGQGLNLPQLQKAPGKKPK